MISAAINSLSVELWEGLEFVGWVMVIAGCVGEGFAEFTKIPKDDTKRHRMGKISWIILVAGLVFEFLGGHFTSIVKDGVIEQTSRDLEVQKARFLPREITQEQSRRFLEAVLTPEQKANLQAPPNLRKFPIQKALLSFCYPSTADEIVKFKGQLATMMMWAGYFSDGEGIQLFWSGLGPSPWNITLVAIPEDKELLALPLQKALTASGIESALKVDRGKSRPGIITIYIGPRN